MEAYFTRRLMPSTPTVLPVRLHSTYSMPVESVGFAFLPRRSDKKMGFSCMVPQSKRSAYQDFQGFAKPSRILPAAEANTFTQNVSEELFSSVELDKSNSFYLVELRTSKEFGSCLRDLNDAILLGLINSNGDSILQRISSVSLQSMDHEDDATDTVHFQRGSMDIVTFRGPKLGEVESLWIGLESGSWRLDGVTLTVVNNSHSFTEEEKIDVTQYKFEAENILLGDGGVSVIELRPIHITKSAPENSTFLKNIYPSSSTSSGEDRVLSNDESMKEYSDLKFSLLLYDFILFFTGSSLLLTFSSDERYAYSFFVGGTCGFLYLLLLQRSVDGLSTDVEMENFFQGFGRLKGPLFSLALVLATVVVGVKYGIGDSSVALTPVDLFIGAAGFLTCKIAVLLAAFKPIKKSF